MHSELPAERSREDVCVSDAVCVCFLFFLREALGRCCVCCTQSSRTAGGGPMASHP